MQWQQKHPLTKVNKQFVTVINKQLSLYGSLAIFQEKQPLQT